MCFAFLQVEGRSAFLTYSTYSIWRWCKDRDQVGAGNGPCDKHINKEGGLWQRGAVRAPSLSAVRPFRRRAVVQLEP